MEFISTNQLQKYENITEQIKHEFEQYEKLKTELETENDNLVISQLSNSSFIQKLSHLNVQVFANFFDLFHIYNDAIHNNCSMTQLENCKVYLIEIYITKSLIEKTRGLQCILHITVNSENVSINKTVILKNKTPIREVIPVDNSIINSTVEVNLVVPSKGKWMVIKLDTVYVDISYHFEKYREKRKQECKLKNIVQVTESYNKVNRLQKQLTLKCKLFCDIEESCFISAILKNCYHALDPELFLELKSSNDKKFFLKLSVGTDIINVTFNKYEKCLELEANIYNLCLLKKYFSKQLYGKTDIDTDLTSDLLKVLKASIDTLRLPQDMCNFFCEVRESWSKLPI